MDARMDLFSNPLVMKMVKYVNSAGAVIHQSGLPAATQELVKIRASQINCCAACTDMHTKDAERTAGPRGPTRAVPASARRCQAGRSARARGGAEAARLVSPRRTGGRAGAGPWCRHRRGGSMSAR